MPVTITWYAPRRVVMVRPHGHITIDDNRLINSSLVEYLAAGDPPVHLLFDQTEVLSFPMDIHQLRDALTVMHHPAVGWVVIYSAPNRVADFVNSLLATIARVQYRKFANRRQALDFLMEQDATLKPLFDALDDA